MFIYFELKWLEFENDKIKVVNTFTKNECSPTPFNANYFDFLFLDSKCEIEEGSEMNEKEMLPVFRPLPVSTGYMAGKKSKFAFSFTTIIVLSF